jgi:hypothetical protein
MPITNIPYGVWKILQWKDSNLGMVDWTSFVVKSANVGTNQETRVEKFVQGTALPVIMNIGGGASTMQIDAPLLVKETIPRTGTATDPTHDGLFMWNKIKGSGVSTGMFNSAYTAETGFIIEELGFKIDATNGAIYTFKLKGDSNYLGEEKVLPGITPDNGLYLADGSTIWNNADTSYHPFTKGVPLRVASFYDVTATIGIGESGVFSGFVENFEITYKFQTQAFNYVGQRTQRQILGIGGAEVSFRGTMISTTVGTTRQPLGYQYPWQAMNPHDDLVWTSTSTKTPGGTYDKYGGIVSVNQAFNISLQLRSGSSIDSGLIDILPGVNVEKNVIQTSQAQYSSDLIRTNFQGMAWVTDPSQLITT